jgi:hypothetical protein
MLSNMTERVSLDTISADFAKIGAHPYTVWIETSPEIEQMKLSREPITLRTAVSKYQKYFGMS